MFSQDVRDQLIVAVLPWAKATDESKYRATLAVAKNLETFDRYLVRLLELRWEQDADETWRSAVPLVVLEESACTLRVKFPNHPTAVQICGKKIATRDWTWMELALLLDMNEQTRQSYLVTKQGLDLVLVGR